MVKLLAALGPEMPDWEKLVILNVCHCIQKCMNVFQFPVL